MIDAKELRIGNIFHAEDDLLCMSCNVKIHSISEKEVNWISITESNKGTVQTDNIIDLEPIPLTTEMEEDYLKNKADWFYRAYINNNPKYIHQLQNFNFIITGKEIEINL